VGLAVFVLCFVPFGWSWAGQTSTPHFEADARLVLIDVQATERGTGKPIPDLRLEDFVVIDSGSRKPVTVFDFEAVPLDLVLLVDTSGGTGRGTAPDLVDSLTLMTAEMRPGDRLGVVSFASKARVKVALTDDEDAALNGIRTALRDRFNRDRDARICDAIYAAAGLFPKRRSELRRRATLLVTHNRDSSGRPGGSRATTALLEANATLQAIVIPQVSYQGGPAIVAGFPGRRIPIRGGKVSKTVLPDLRSVDPIAEATGGDVIRYGSEDLASFGKALQRLRSRYLLGFPAEAPTGKRQFRDVRVELTEEAKRLHPDVLLRARRGYYRD